MLMNSCSIKLFNRLYCYVLVLHIHELFIFLNSQDSKCENVTVLELEFNFKGEKIRNYGIPVFVKQLRLKAIEI